MARYKKIEVGAARTDDEKDVRNAVIVERVDTIAEAKKKAKRYLTDEFSRSAEMSEPLLYAWVEADGVLLDVFYHKDHPKTAEAA